MNIVNGRPPNEKELERAFPGLDWDMVIVTYGENVYTKYDLPDHLVEHEAVHVKQHLAYPGGPAAWWARNIADPAFRFEQEVEAYRAQVRCLRSHKGDRNALARTISRLAADLSGPMYGRIVSHSEALRAISTG